MLHLVLAVLLSQDVSLDSFEKLHVLIRPVEKEAPWSEIPWMTSLMTSVVAESSGSKVRLRLEGSAQGDGPEFRFEGVVDYDPAQKAFTRFDLTAFSETGHTDKQSGKLLPLGIAFQLASGERTIDRVPPYFFTIDRWGGDPKAMAEAYFKLRK